jgi:hypothetical protein
LALENDTLFTGAVHRFWKSGMGEIPASLSGEGPAEFASATLESWPKHTGEKAAAPRSWGGPHVGHRVTVKL